MERFYTWIKVSSVENNTEQAVQSHAAGKTNMIAMLMPSSANAFSKETIVKLKALMEKRRKEEEEKDEEKGGS